MAELLRFSVETEFHLLGQHDQESHAGHRAKHGEVAGVGQKKTPAEIVKRKALLKKVAIGAGVVAVVAGVSFTTYKKAPGSFRWSDQYRRSDRLERLKENGGSEFETQRAKIIEELNKEGGREGKRKRLERDLGILDGEYKHQNDIFAMVDRLRSNKYTDEERDAMWKFGGLREVNTDENGRYADIEKGPGGENSFNIKLRKGRKLTDEEAKVVLGMDAAIKRNHLPRDLTLFRGIALSQSDAEKLAGRKPGEIISDPAPIYTGLTEERAAPHHKDAIAQGGEQVLFRIKAPKGLPAVRSPYGETVGERGVPLRGVVVPRVPLIRRIVSGYAKGGRTVFRRVPFIEHFNKEELVLQRNQPLRILNSRRRSDGVLIVDVEAVNER